MRRVTLILALTVCSMLAASCSNDSPGTFTCGDNTFLLNGEPFVIKAAELHYPRIPRDYWEHRILSCKALGMNTICLYVFWNFHEEEPGCFDFTGQKDIAEFCRLCQKHDMLVILRPGPYVCAEWEMGGLPWWLLKKKDVRLREDDEYFVERVRIFQEALAGHLKNMTINDGGPVIMIQVENEYGSYGENKRYVAMIRDILREHYPDVTLFQCDWSSNFTLNGLDDLVWTMNYGTGADIDQQFARLKELRPDSPLMCSEFWSGWFDKWGANHEIRPADAMVSGIDEMLSKGISFSLYMTHGGTNWGHWAGANSPGFAPDVTSYDYDAPINEQGRPTEKYWMLRETLAKHTGESRQTQVPDDIEIITIDKFSFTGYAPLFENLPAPKIDRDIKTMEEYDQGYGSILYRTSLPELKEASVLTVEAHDFARIFVDGVLAGQIDRRMGETQVTLTQCREGARLDILVEAMGRINFGRAIKDFKGIVSDVLLTDENGSCSLKEWEVYNLRDEYEFYKGLKFIELKDLDNGGQRVPGCYRATFHVDTPGDTFLDFESWGKGLVYVNGHGIGRIWEIGPQQTLYVPGCWLKKGKNEIIVFDVIGPKEAVCEGLAEPIIDRLNMQKPKTHRAEGQTLDLSGKKPVTSGVFARGNGWQKVKFDKPASGRYVCLEALDSYDGGDLACVSELYVLNPKGKRLQRENWKVVYADSEEVTYANRSADKSFDLQESTFWSSDYGMKFPHCIVIDLGDEYEISGFEYLPRMESNTPGAIRNYNLYIGDIVPTPEQAVR